LNSYFNGFSQCLKINLNDTKNTTDYIDHSLFADIIAMLALEMKYRDNNINLTEKVIDKIYKIDFNIH